MTVVETPEVILLEQGPESFLTREDLEIRVDAYRVIGLRIPQFEREILRRTIVGNPNKKPRNTQGARGEEN